MKIYRCIIGSLLVFFIAIGVWYIASCYNERRSNQDGTLIQEKRIDSTLEMRGDDQEAAGYGVC